MHRTYLNGYTLRTKHKKKKIDIMPFTLCVDPL